MRGLLATILLVACAALESAVTNWVARFSDVAVSAGLTGKNVYGGLRRKDYILETTGNGIAIFDYDGDGADDIFLANGSTLQSRAGEGAAPQLYHNDGRGHFTDVAAKAGLIAQGWGQGVCVGDYDNDGHPDLLVTYYGHNVLYRNRGCGRFGEATPQERHPVHWRETAY